MEYRGYLIKPNLTGYVNFDFYKPDDELIAGNGKTIEDCKIQIDELNLNNECDNPHCEDGFVETPYGHVYGNARCSVCENKRDAE